VFVRLLGICCGEGGDGEGVSLDQAQGGEGQVEVLTGGPGAVLVWEG
jgi:hypothetical protein